MEVKGPEKPQDLPKKKRNWPLRELKSIDGKWNLKQENRFGLFNCLNLFSPLHRIVINTFPVINTTCLFIFSEDKLQNESSFVLGLGEKSFKWNAINFEEKKRFLSTLVRGIALSRDKRIYHMETKQISRLLFIVTNFEWIYNLVIFGNI